MVLRKEDSICQEADEQDTAGKPRMGIPLAKVYLSAKRINPPDRAFDSCVMFYSALPRCRYSKFSGQPLFRVDLQMLRTSCTTGLTPESRRPSLRRGAAKVKCPDACLARVDHCERANNMDDLR